MIFKDRCPICTLKPPCRHHLDTSTFPKPIDLPSEPVNPEVLPENPGIIDIIPPTYSMDLTTQKQSRNTARSAIGSAGSTTIRYRGKTLETKTGNFFGDTADSEEIQRKRREQNRVLQKKLRNIEAIEAFRERKLREEIARIDKEKADE
jgi:hypothetical protein